MLLNYIKCVNLLLASHSISQSYLKWGCAKNDTSACSMRFNVDFMRWDLFYYALWCRPCFSRFVHFQQNVFWNTSFSSTLFHLAYSVLDFAHWNWKTNGEADGVSGTWVNGLVLLFYNISWNIIENSLIMCS